MLSVSSGLRVADMLDAASKEVSDMADARLRASPATGLLPVTTVSRDPVRLCLKNRKQKRLYTQLNFCASLHRKFFVFFFI
jgi:hypothetical protein